MPSTSTAPAIILVLPLPHNFYAQWRAHHGADGTLHETADAPTPTERLLQLVWHHQRVRRDALRTSSGQRVRVLHPGFWNHEPGPDFREAMIQLGDAPPVAGDVEIDLSPHGWRGHGHDVNPQYQRVVLHVVWEGGPAANAPRPTLPLKDALDSPLDELRQWLGADTAKDLPGLLAGQCSAPLHGLAPEVWGELVRQAAQVRLQAKASQLQARAREAGWEQALWEGLFGALGYKHNVWPMRRLAELIPSLAPPPGGAAVRERGRRRDKFLLQARLLGLSGLLPAELPRAAVASSDYVRRVWDFWWRERGEWLEFVLPRAAWRLAGLRPANHPQRRLALAAAWLADAELISKLERWFAGTLSEGEWLPTLLEILQPAPDEFWSWHWTFTARRMRCPQPLLGPSRVTDLAVNVILPWFWMRAVAGKNQTLQRVAEQRYFAWPKSEDNAVLRLARQRLFGAKAIRGIRTAAAQQGLLQIVRDFCAHSNALCEHCRFPHLVRDLRPGK